MHLRLHAVPPWRHMHAKRGHVHTHVCRGYADVPVGTYLADVNECLSSPCLNGARCFDHSFSYACVCVVGFDGYNCEINDDECGSSPCLNGAACTDMVEQYACVCASGWFGGMCENGPNSCTRAENDCDSLHALCFGTSFVAFAYDTCPPSCISQYGDPYLPVCTTSCAMRCNSYFDHYDTETRCEPKYVHAPAADVKTLYESGVIKDETVIQLQFPDSNLQSTLSTFSKVKDEYMGKHEYVHKHTCVCKMGYETTDGGKTCTTIPPNCANVVGKCLNGGTCVNIMDVNMVDVVCVCVDGWAGKRCQIDLRVCACGSSFPCAHGGVCSDGVHAYSCACGFISSSIPDEGLQVGFDEYLTSFGTNASQIERQFGDAFNT